MEKRQTSGNTGTQSHGSKDLYDSRVTHENRICTLILWLALPEVRGNSTVITYYMHQITWNQFGVRVPELSRPIAMRNLITILEDDERGKEKDELTRSVLLAYGRTKEPICRIIVDNSSEKDFQSLQNDLLMSRLS